MTKITRRRLLATGLAAASAVGVGAFPMRARGAEFPLKFGHAFPDTHPINVHALAAAKAIKERTGGRVEVEVFGNNQLGGDTQMLSQVRSGAIQLFTTGGLILATLVPVASINGMGFAFKDYDEVWRTMDGALGAHIRGAFEKAGLHCFGKCWDNGFREVSSSTHPIAAPADLKGFKIRVPVSPLYTSTFEALGASPTSINFAEVYSSLQTKIVEGQENPLVLIAAAKLYEVQKYVSMTNHIWDGCWVLANGPTWKAMPKNLQEIVASSLDEAGLVQRADMATQNRSVESELKAKGIVFNTVDAQPFRDALRKAGFYKRWADKYGPEPWGLLEKSVGTLI